ncbi:unknown protein [Bathycoccus prasinos]|uniref:Uncharacterized protein n=1 Tax=Bathycoccus prasinos TaxID=41875 RepID=K8EMX2_9CHLO|nr:unknown protein [Bathycoccus prasinos]CCO19572.1 unknown protein [Bathycoccus prasinos]|eukprot:XP_007509115.1 unknown protein [Bathycoccus prasinos]
MSISKNSTRMRLERHFDLNEKVKRIAFVQCSYIEEVGKLAIGNAEYGVSIFIETEFVSHKVEQGRSQINILDVLQGLQALGDDLKSIILYADTLDSKPFAIPLPKKFVIRRRPKVQTSFLKVAEPQPTNIPHYFPAFPDKHTYSNRYGLRSAKKIEKKHTDRRKESKIMLKAESGSFNGNVMNKVGENFRKIKRKQEIEKFDTFMDRYNVNFCGK